MVFRDRCEARHLLDPILPDSAARYSRSPLGGRIASGRSRALGMGRAFRVPPLIRLDRRPTNREIGFSGSTLPDAIIEHARYLAGSSRCRPWTRYDILRGADCLRPRI